MKKKVLTVATVGVIGLSSLTPAPLYAKGMSSSGGRSSSMSSSRSSSSSSSRTSTPKASTKSSFTPKAAPKSTTSTSSTKTKAKTKAKTTAKKAVAKKKAKSGSKTVHTTHYISSPTYQQRGLSWFDYYILFGWTHSHSDDGCNDYNDNDICDNSEKDKGDN